MMPEVSAGSNHVGASVTCTAQVSWPSGPAARPEQGMPKTKAAAASARTRLRVVRDLAAWKNGAPPNHADENIGNDWARREVMAYSPSKLRLPRPRHRGGRPPDGH